MEEEKSQDGGEQPTAEQPVVDATAAPASEESVDESEDLSEYGVPAMPAEEEEEAEAEPTKKPSAKAAEENQEEVEAKEVPIPKIAPPEPRPTRLDRRLASRYIHNLHLSGETEIPTEEVIIADLKKYSKEEKIEALKFHLRKEKELRGERPTNDDLEDEDKAAINDAEREAIRQEILTEENERKVKENFVEFIDEHPELLPENKKEYNPRLARAVETLWKGGMPISEAYETVTESISLVKADGKKEIELNKQKLLSGSVSATNDFTKGGKHMTWEEFDKLRTEDPTRYEKLLDEGYEPSDE